DFTETEVELGTGTFHEIWPGGVDGEKYRDYAAYFPGYPLGYTLRQRWFTSDAQHRDFAAVVFAHRNRDHPFSEYVRSRNPLLSNQDIMAVQKG
ncbi:MAG: hypothetical protein V4671_29920, partial [Armatimonadota bacterium]